MNHPRALVTMLIGKNYQRLWEQQCRANWEMYAARHDADVIVLDTHLDTSPRAMTRQRSWQKLLILGEPRLAAYEQVVWLDADILIHPRALWVGENVPRELIGVTDEYEYPTRELNFVALTRLYRFWEKQNIRFARNATPREFYALAGYDKTFDRAAQSGVMVMNPQAHRSLLEHVYYTREGTQLDGLNGEMRPLSYELLSANCVHWLAPQWNALWQQEKALSFPFLYLESEHPLLSLCATRALAKNYFLHFAGALSELAAVDLTSPLLQVPPRNIFPAPHLSPPPQCQSPVALFLFNRPETTAHVMEAIRAVRPRELYLVADGPRENVPDDVTRCEAARQVALKVDWECKVSTNFAEKNLGLKARVESGLNWVFENAAEAILLEDDCVPDETFFRFCDEMLERYRNDTRVFMVSGNDFKFGLDTQDSYTFSRYPLIWGWATWKRAWQKNDVTMRTLPGALATNRLSEKLDSARAVQYWAYTLQEHFQTQTTWDYTWLWSIWENDGLCIHPNTNLVENVGFGAQATHTRDDENLFAELIKARLEFPLQHPTRIERNRNGDALVEEIAFSGTLRQLWKRVRARRDRLQKAN